MVSASTIMPVVRSSFLPLTHAQRPCLLEQRPRKRVGLQTQRLSSAQKVAMLSGAQGAMEVAEA